jgi:hypothetical protein
MDSLEPRQTVGVLFTEPPNATVVWGLYWGGGNRGFAAFIDGALVVHRHDPEDSFGLLGLFGFVDRAGRAFAIFYCECIHA